MEQITVDQAMRIAVAHHSAGRWAEAEKLYRQVLAAVPEHADALHMLGVLASQAGRPELAVELIARSIALKPTAAEYHSNLGEVYRRSGRLDDAITCALRAIELKPGMARAHSTLGCSLRDQGRLDEAIATLERAVRLDPNDAEAHDHLGKALADAGRLDAAIEAFGRAIERRPDFPEAHNSRGLVLRRRGRHAEARTSFEAALELRPEHPALLNSLAVALLDVNRHDEAAAVLRRAIELRPDYPEAHQNLGVALHSQGYVEEAILSYQHALSLQPSDTATHSKLLMSLQYQSGANLAGLARAHAEWNIRLEASCGQASPPGDHEHDRNPQRRLRLGFVSPDLYRHPVGSFLLPVLENLDSGELAVVCYSLRAHCDDCAERLAAAASEWHDVAGLDATRLARKIRDDRIDILVDLAGHSGEGDLRLFAVRPAPIQMTWIGYVGTTGLAAMDYLIADRFHVPPEAESYYTERVLRMPAGYVCFEPPTEAPDIGPLPAMARGHVTFGSFNNVSKLSADVIALWARITRRVPGSRLLLVAPALNGVGTRERIATTFVAAGGNLEQLEMQGALPRSELLAAYNSVDLALDPFPYSGGMTTCEALWMGVPVVTCPGETFASRHSLSHLSNIGLTETIVSNLDDYTERAVQLVADLQHLAGLRAGLRERMAGSPLCDAPRFARNLAVHLRNAWRDWCQQPQQSLPA